jgi:hypothetical protein
MTEVKKLSLLGIASLIKRGKSPAQICKELNVSKQSLNYWLSIGKRIGLFRKKGYGVWEVDTMQEVNISSKDTTSQLGLPKEVRGHAFIWKVRLAKKQDWKRILSEKNIEFREVGLKGTPRVMVENRKIWLGKENIVIYEPASFFSVNAVESRKLAVFKLISILKRLEEKLGIEIGNYKFTPRREHYSLIKNALAIQCNEKGEKIYVKDDDVGLWLVIDNSYNLHEFETQSEKALPLNIVAQNYWNSHKRTGFKVTPEFVLDSISHVTQNQEMFAKNLETHIDAIKTLSSAVNELKEVVRKLQGDNHAAG